MDARNKLLDKAREACSPPTWAALAEKMGVSRQLVSQWVHATNPLSEDRVRELAQIAHEDAAVWLVAVAAAQATGETARAWQRAAQRLGFAATFLLAFVAYAPPSHASEQGSQHGAAETAVLDIMRTRALRRVLEIAAAIRAFVRTFTRASRPHFAAV